MANLTRFEKLNFEKLFGMGSGYVLDFSNRTFEEFIASARLQNPKSWAPRSGPTQFWDDEKTAMAIDAFPETFRQCAEFGCERK